AQAPVGFAVAVTLPDSSESVVLDWDNAPVGDVLEFEVRSLTDGIWSPWVHVGASYEEAPDDAPAPTSAGPVWVGTGTEQVEARLLAGSPTGLRLHALDMTMPEPSRFGIAGAVALPGPGIISASQWGSPGWATQNDGCGSRPSYADTVDYAIVHHTVTTNDYSASQAAAQILSVYWQHVNANGWCDIAYNFVVDRHGQTWEGRSGGVDRPVIGGHARGFNTSSTGVVMLGQYQPGASPASASPAPAQRDALRRLLAWKLGLHGVDPTGTVVVTSQCTGSCRYQAGTQVSLPTITSHRAVGQTACPGDNAEAVLAGLRPLVAADVANSGPFTVVPTLEGDRRFVAKAYLDLLARPVDAGALEHWSGVVLRDGRQTFTRALVHSSSCEWSRRVVNDLFLDILGRPVDPGGLAYWSGRICRGEPARLIASLIYASIEYYRDPNQGGGTPEGYARSLYNDILGRTPSSFDVAFWAGEVRRRGIASVAANFYQSLESRERRVRHQYDLLLGRQPDRGGLTYWAAQLGAVDDLALTVELTASDEYYLTP
ncbi:MAG: N-acetylmuramoyl-L-alanine amidase, partial [Acidimicrobiia bacterium]|nr:N-acetylmuramoyl-L-alanine amidase [Acidimicrobiia bacterium]